MIWDAKYRLKTSDGRPLEQTIEETWRRVAGAVARPEKGGARKAWRRRFYEAMSDFSFLPAGRILAGAGTRRRVTLANCFVMGTIADDMASIFENLKEAALTLQMGGGIGHDFSTLRPAGAEVVGVGADASGPLSFMDVWDAMCRTILSAGGRRGAMMATLSCDHPDIEAFIAAKSDPARFRNFNLSVLVSDAFIAAVERDGPWHLQFNGRHSKTLRARELWQQIMRATYETAEPGVIFIDRINAENNLSYCEEIRATNPCGEQPLPPYGACFLGSINLARLVSDPFGRNAGIDTGRLEELTRLAVRFLDNVIDISRFALARQRKEARHKRRIGLGVTGLADALILCGVRYGSARAQRLAQAWMRTIQNAAYRASVELAREKGVFPAYERASFLAAPGVGRLDEAVQRAIAKHGVRNGLLTSVAPTGTISLLAGNVSSGVEPVFDFTYRRRLHEPGDGAREIVVEDWAYRLYRQRQGPEAALPEAFVTARDLTPEEHLDMQAALQPYVDSAISKTINCPADMTFEDFSQVYLDAYRKGLKGCTTYRPSEVRGAVLVSSAMADGGASGAQAQQGARTGAQQKVRTEAQQRITTAGPRKVTTQAQQRATTASHGRAMVPAPATAVAAESEHASFGEPLAEAAGSAYARTSDKLSTAGERLPEGAASELAPSLAPSDVVYMCAPLERPGDLAGHTYKLKWPDSDDAYYITINDIVVDGRRRPFEIFINTKNLEHYAWIVALTRMISAIFRRGGDVSFVVDELKAIFDPRGGQWLGGRYVPSLIAAIGDIVERHLKRIGFLTGAEEGGASDAAPGPGVRAGARMDRTADELTDAANTAGARRATGATRAVGTPRTAPTPKALDDTGGTQVSAGATDGTSQDFVGATDGARAVTGATTRTIANDTTATIAGNAPEPAGEPTTHLQAMHGMAPGPLCPRCKRAALVHQEGCLSCRNCGYSKCS